MDNKDFDGLFAMSDIKRTLKNQQTGYSTFRAKTEKHPFEIPNLNTYDSTTNEVIIKATQIEANTQFLIQLNRLYILDVQQFLDFHFERTTDKIKFFRYIKYSSLNSEIIQSNGIKSTIADWVKDHEGAETKPDVLEFSKFYSGKKIGHKYFALYHWILIEMGKEKHFEKDQNDRFDKKKIELFAIKRYGLKNGQGFYKAYTDIDTTDRNTIAKSFGKEYKNKVIAISNNNADVISHLKKYPN